MYHIFISRLALECQSNLQRKPCLFGIGLSCHPTGPSFLDFRLQQCGTNKVAFPLYLSLSALDAPTILNLALHPQHCDSNKVALSGGARLLFPFLPYLSRCSSGAPQLLRQALTAVTAVPMARGGTPAHALPSAGGGIHPQFRPSS